MTQKICISADSCAVWREYPSEILWDIKLIATDFGEIRIPVHYDELLKLMYGNYMDIPPLENRIHEVMHNYHRIKSFLNRM